MEDLAGHEGPALVETVRPLEPAVEVIPKLLVDFLVLFVAVWR